MGILWEDRFLIFLILTVILGGGAAFIAGRSLALGWKSLGLLTLYMLVLGAGLRFLHFALFKSELTSAHYYLTDTAILFVAAFLGYRLTRTRQMTEKYPWLYERSSPFSWRPKTN